MLYKYLMEHKLVENISVKKPKQLFKKPNSLDTHYRKDQKTIFEIGSQGTDLFTSHVIQDLDWTNIEFQYYWNSLGLRGPEPDYNKDNRILFAGGSLCLGTGLPLENSFPYILANMLDASYINISDADNISDFIEPLKKFKDFNPSVVVISDTRFIQLYSWALVDIYRVRTLENNKMYKDIFAECDQNFLLMFEAYLKNLFPQAQLIFAYCVRRTFKNIIPNFEHFKVVRFERNEIVDLARDNAHPGIRSHLSMAEKIYNSIKN